MSYGVASRAVTQQFLLFHPDTEAQITSNFKNLNALGK